MGIAAALTFAYQGVYVFQTDLVTKENYPTEYDTDAHRYYFQYVYNRDGDPMEFRDSLAWNHFPAFYQWNALVARSLGGLLGVPNLHRRLQIAWFTQAVLQVGALGLCLLAFRLLFRRPAATIAAFLMVATAARVFVTGTTWSQDIYIFFFSAVTFYVVVKAVRHRLTPALAAVGALAAAFGLLVKITMLIPLAAMLIAFACLPRRRASPRGIAAAILFTLAAAAAVNWQFIGTEAGRRKLLWLRHGARQYYRSFDIELNADDIVRSYLKPDWSVLLRPRQVTAHATLEAESTSTATYVYLFELFDHFQGPPRTWLNMACLWSGTAVAALALARMVRTAFSALRCGRAKPLDLYFGVLVAASMAALIALSLSHPRGWAIRPEHATIAYPAAAALALRELLWLPHRLRRIMCAAVVFHIVANIAMLSHVAAFKLR